MVPLIVMPPCLQNFNLIWWPSAFKQDCDHEVVVAYAPRAHPCSPGALMMIGVMIGIAVRFSESMTFPQIFVIVM